MLNTKKSYIVATTLFVVAQIILSVFIQLTRDVTYGILTVSSVSLACIFVLVNYKRKGWFLLALAFINTVIADTFLSGLALLDFNQIIAMCFFIVVQSCYFLILYTNHTTVKQKVIHVIVRSAVSIIAVLLTVLVLKEKTNALVIIAMIYFANLLVNVVYAFIQIRLSLLLPIGLLLFVLCDIFIGISVLYQMFPFPTDSFLYTLNTFISNPAWMFYVPSQTILALTVKENLLIKRK